MKQRQQGIFILHESAIIRISCAILSAVADGRFTCGVVVITSALNAGDWGLSPLH